MTNMMGKYWRSKSTGYIGYCYGGLMSTPDGDLSRKSEKGDRCFLITVNNGKLDFTNLENFDYDDLDPI